VPALRFRSGRMVLFRRFARKRLTLGFKKEARQACFSVVPWAKIPIQAGGPDFSSEEPMVESVVVSALDCELRFDPAELMKASPGLQLVYETAPVGLAFLSIDCRYLMINQHLTEICGISIDDHLGRSVREIVPQVAEQVEKIVQHIVRSGEPITGVEVNGQRADGSNVDRVWITYWHPLKSNDGEVVGVNVAAEEITERKRAEAEQAAMHNRLQQLNESLAERVEIQAQERDRFWRLSQDLLIVTDAQGTVLNINPAWTATLGWTHDDLVGKTGEWLIHPADRERSLGELVGLRTGKPSDHFENRIQCKDGSYRWLSWRSIADRSFRYAIARDITNLKQTQEQLHTLRSELAQSSRQTTFGAMTASIAHEIKQPLGAIAANAQAGLRWLKRSEPNQAEAEAALERIVRDTARIDDIVTSIRSTFARKSKERSTVDIGSIVGQALALTQRELEAHRVALKDNASGDRSVVLADRVQLQQVLVNLIVNAVEAMSSVNEQERQLTLDSNINGAEISITVTDTGTGIEPGNLDRIFEPFFTTKSEGMGLGLSICRSIAEAHGGRLWASAHKTGRTIFHLMLPLAASDR
jgi:PAS domain S-box-containing protein